MDPKHLILPYFHLAFRLYKAQRALLCKIGAKVAPVSHFPQCVANQPCLLDVPNWPNFHTFKSTFRLPNNIWGCVITVSNLYQRVDSVCPTHDFFGLLKHTWFLCDRVHIRKVSVSLSSKCRTETQTLLWSICTFYRIGSVRDWTLIIRRQGVWIILGTL